MNDMLTYTGGAIKALGNGAFEAPLIRFGDAKSTDLSTDFFDADTNLWIDAPATVVFLYDHGQDETLKNRKLGGGSVEIELRDGDDAGYWMKGQLNIADKYESAIYQLIEAKKLGTSSGAVSHLVTREKVGSASHIKDWPLYEASLTPTPCEGRNYGKVVAVKSLPTNSFKSLLKEIEAGETDTPPTTQPAATKAVYLGDNAESMATSAAISRLNDLLMYSVVSAALSGDDYSYRGIAAPFSTMKPAEITAYLTGAFNEFRDMSLNIIDTLLAGTADETPETAAKSLRAVYADPASDAPRPLQLLAGQELKTYLKTMGTVVEDFGRRLSWYEGERAIKQGRPISKDNLTAMQSIHDGLTQQTGKLKELLDKHADAPHAAENKKSIADETSESAIQSYLRFQQAASVNNLTF